MTYLNSHLQSRHVTPQNEAILGSDQVENSAGGFVYEVDDFERLRRFLILGSEGGSYYAGEKQLTTDNVEAVKNALRTDGPRVVQEVVEVSVGGRAPKNDQAIFVLALASSPQFANDSTRKAALDAIPSVCRTGTHLFMYCEFVNKLRGWGRGLREGVSKWYTEKDADKLAYQLVKYRQREGWTHRDVLRLSHAKSDDNEINRVIDWTVHGDAASNAGILPRPILGFYRAQRAETPADTAQLISEYGLTHEMIKTEHKTDALVWEALLENMPMTAMIRNLANMTRAGILDPGKASVNQVLNRLSNPDLIRKSRVHPIQVLMALRTYASGRGFRGTNTWTPNNQIIDALNEAFYLAFDNVEPTGKRRLLAIDISGSMAWGAIAGTNLYPRDAAAAMALVSANSGDPYDVIVFSARGGGAGFFANEHGRWGSSYNNWGVTPVNISPRQRLDDVVEHINSLPAGGTDCALPMIYAKETGREYDAFEIYTDNETWAGSIHPSQALHQYRDSSGIHDAKLIVIGMVSNGFSIADPNDRGMLDVVGFDASAPSVMSDFISGRI